MEHKEFRRIVPGADIAVLMIHGIAGTPNQFRDLLPLIPEGISVHNLLLDGHGKTVVDFSKTSMSKWEQQVDRAVAQLLLSHKQILLVAHSMGTLFALEQAVKQPGVAGLFLLAAPLKIWLRPRMYANAFQVYLGKIKPEDIIANATKDSYGIGPDRNLLHYIGWIPRYLELFAKIRETREIIPAVNTPCQVFQSRKDEMVAAGAERYFKENPSITVTCLADSGHFYYGDQDLALLKKAFRDMLKQLECQKEDK